MHELDILYSKLEKKAGKRIEKMRTDDILTACNRANEAYIALANLLKGSVDLHLILKDAGIEQDTIGEINRSLFIVTALLDSTYHERRLAQKALDSQE